MAEGKIAYSQDFEQGLAGMSRSPSSLPEDRIQIIDDPTGQRGKIVRIEYRGTVSMTFHRGSGRTGPIMKLEPMKWYDFRVDTDYREGGECRFFINGKMVGTGRSVGGANARFDFGTYWRPGAHPARTVYISNVSIGEM